MWLKVRVGEDFAILSKILHGYSIFDGKQALRESYVESQLECGIPNTRDPNA